MIAAAIWVLRREDPYIFHPSGLHGTITNVAVLPAGDTCPLGSFRLPDVDLTSMAAWSLRCLRKDPRPSLDYEPVFFVRPIKLNDKSCESAGHPRL